MQIKDKFTGLVSTYAEVDKGLHIGSAHNSNGANVYSS